MIEDVIDQAISQTLWEVDEAAEHIGWDSPPQLFIVMLHPLHITSEIEGVGIEMKQMSGWDIALELGENISESLSAMSSLLESIPSEMKRTNWPAENLYGLVMVTEAWIVHPDSQAAFDRIKLAKQQGRFMELANRIETRYVFSVSTRGRRATLHHERHGVIQMHGHDDNDYDRTIPLRLSTLMKELT